MDLDGPKLQRALFISVMAVLLTSDPVISDGTSSCTNDCAPFIPGAVAYWPMTWETKGSDLSGNDNHATLVGLSHTDGPTGVRQGALHFHGNRSSYAWVMNSSSMDVGTYNGFSFGGFVRFSDVNRFVSLIDWSDAKKKRMYISKSPERLYIGLAPNTYWSAGGRFPKLEFIKGLWQFFGISYDKATGRVTAFIDGMKYVKTIPKYVVADTTTSKIGLGIELLRNDYTFKGDMSCMMLFKVALTAEDFERVWKFCRTRTSTRTTLPDITVSDILTTMATASWTESPGTFREYSITIERRGKALGQEVVYPKSLDSSVLSPSVMMVNLIPGATYRVHVWHMMGAIRGRAKTSPWFDTKPVFVRPESISVTMITATTANVTWKEEIDVFDAYYVDISPTTGGAIADPSTVPRGTTTTSLKNLSPAINYTIVISTKVDPGRTSSPLVKSFQTPALNEESLQITDQRKAGPPTFPTIAHIALIASGICLVLMFVFAILIVTIFRRINSLSTNKRVDRRLPTSNLGVQPGEEDDTYVNGEYDGYEIPDRCRNASRVMPQQAIGDNNEASPGPIYEDLNNSGRG